ncbi:MAG TPA: DUF1996 domain-containing protein [Gaiellaceae bacterium]|nr:DUF1996 domain-containing protein [Gaiellaceae bacterium]
MAGIAVAAASAAAEAQPPPPPAPAPSVEALQGVNFVSACGFSHRATDDPIVYPKQPGASHDHSFVGNVSTNAFSKPYSLRQAGTTCHRPLDTAAYWMPTLLVAGQPVAPRMAQVYYRRSTLAPVTAFPQGFKVVAGSAVAAEPQARRVTFWNCGAEGGVPQSSTVPTCPDTRSLSLRLHVNFPDCWDGRRLDSPDHKSHTAYSTKSVCPSTHPVAVPRISLIYAYPVTGGPDVSLASGSQFSAHGDFLNAWNQAELESLVAGCLNALRHCQRGS